MSKTKLKMKVFNISVVYKNIIIIQARIQDFRKGGGGGDGQGGPLRGGGGDRPCRRKITI